jgi:L-asparaginase II
MLLACRLLELSREDYVDPGHPLQRKIKTILARYADVAESEIAVAVDGCNLPVFRLPLSALARAYARLLAPRVAGESPASASARARLVRAMWRSPFMVAGTARFTTDFLSAGSGRWIGKEGAEGVYVVGLAGSGRNGPATGIAFKIEDGSARPRDAVTLDLLAKLGRLPESDRRAFSSYAEPTLHNAIGVDVGRIEADAPIARPASRRRRRA